MFQLKDFAAAQARYYLACSTTLQQLQKELGALSLHVSSLDMQLDSPSTAGTSERKQARVICDYDSQDSSEMSLIAGEVVLYHNSFSSFVDNIILYR